MATSLAPSVSERDHTRVASLDVRELEDGFLDECAKVIGRTAPRGARPRDLHQLGQDLRRERGTRTLERVMRWLAAAVAHGADARELGEVLADVLGAAVATVCNLSDAALAETLAACHERPAKEIATRAARTLDDVNAAIAAGRQEEHAHSEYMRSLVREKLFLLNPIRAEHAA